MLIGIGMIVLGIVFGILTTFFGVLYIPCGMVFGVLSSMGWAKEFYAAANFEVGTLYLWFGSGIIILWLLSMVNDDGFSVSPASFVGGVIIASLFIVTGLLAFPGPAAFINAHIAPLLDGIAMRVGALLLIILVFALFPMSIVFMWLFSRK